MAARGELGMDGQWRKVAACDGDGALGSYGTEVHQRIQRTWLACIYRGSCVAESRIVVRTCGPEIDLNIASEYLTRFYTSLLASLAPLQRNHELVGL